MITGLSVNIKKCKELDYGDPILLSRDGAIQVATVESVRESERLDMFSVTTTPFEVLTLHKDSNIAVLSRGQLPLG